MSAPIVDPAAQVEPTPPAAEQPPAPQEPAGEAAQQTGGEMSREDALEALAKVRKENASWRTKYREAEPILKAHQEAEDAAKSELEKASERAAAAEARVAELESAAVLAEVAGAHGIAPENYDLLGSGTREELEARAQRIAAIGASSRPPTDRPVESLKPGASPEPPAPADDSYPAAWRPNHLPNQ